MLYHKGWRKKTTWLKFSASPVASTKQFFIEEDLQVVKNLTKCIKFTQKPWVKSMPMYRC